MFLLFASTYTMNLFSRFMPWVLLLSLENFVRTSHWSIIHTIQTMRLSTLFGYIMLSSALSPTFGSIGKFRELLTKSVELDR